MTPVSGATRVCFMVGRPVDKARTPALFNAWAQRTGQDVVMVGAAIGPDGLADLFSTLRRLENGAGAVVTYPHKQAVFPLLDEADDAARFNEACNVVRRTAEGRLVGTMTDGMGCVAAMERHGATIAGSDVLLIGAGGAGSAIAHEAARRGAARLVVRDLDTDRRDALLTRLSAAVPGSTLAAEVAADLRYTVVCNATPLGMQGETALPWPLDDLPAHTLVADVVPTPAMTPWLLAAQARGLRVQTGPDMVAAQFGLVTGHLLGLAPEAIEQAADVGG